MDARAALEQIQQPQDLTILALSAPILSSLRANASSPNKRSSNASSTDGQQNATPAALIADLNHYRDLFTKLRFSYTEQVTKERFLRSLTASPPDFVDAAENAELQRRLDGEKAALKQKKTEVRETLADIEEQSRHLARRYEVIQLQTTQLEALPDQIANLQSAIDELQQAQAPKSSNPSLSLPLQPTLGLLSERESELADVEAQIASLRAALPEKQREVEALRAEMGPLETRKRQAVAEAKDAQRARENGGLGDEIEERGRWLRAVDSSMRSMLEV